MINVKIISKPKTTASGGTIATTGTGGAAYGQETVKEAVHSAEADHAARADEATHATQADRAALADEATHAARADEATHAASSATLDSDSPVWDSLRKLFLSKTDDDTAAGLITFLKGIILGSDGKYGITSEGIATLQSLLINSKWGITKDGLGTLARLVADELKSSGFRQGYMDGAGFGIYQQDGSSYAEVDNLIVRMKAVFAELEIRKLSYVGGDQVHSFAGSQIAMVKPLDADGSEIADSDTTTTVAAYKCYFIDDDGTTRTENWWQVGDQARCQTFNINSPSTYRNVSNRYYWRLVTATGEEDVAITDADGNATTRHMGYVVLSNTAGLFTLKDPSDSTKNLQYNGTDIAFKGYDDSTVDDAPAAEDRIVQLGSQSNPDRAYAYIIYVTEQRRVDYAGINDYNLDTHAVAQYSPKGSFVYSKYFQMRSGDAGSWHPMTNYRGAWASDIAFSYYDTVTHDGLLWVCTAEDGSTGSEPSLFSEVWECISDGGNGLRIEFESDKGSVVYVSNVDLTLTARLMFGQKDYTEYLFKDSRNQLAWSRDSGVESEDKSWTPTMGDTANILLLTHHKTDADNRKDLGSKWEETLSCSFTFSADIYSGDTASTAKKNVSGTVSFDLLG